LTDNITIDDIEDINAPIAYSKNVPINEPVHSNRKRKYTAENQIKEITNNKYQCNGSGITFHDIMVKFSVNKQKAQRTLKYFHKKNTLFTAKDLEEQGISLNGIKKSNPQKYYLTDIKSKIIKDYKNVQNRTTGVKGVKAQSYSVIIFYIIYRSAKNTEFPRHFMSTLSIYTIYP